MTFAFSIDTTTDTVVAAALGAAAVLLLLVLVVVTWRWRRDVHDARFLRSLVGAEGLLEALQRALREAQAVTDASAALISAGDRSGEQLTETLGMTPGEGEAHRFGHGRRVRSVLVEVESEGGEPWSLEFDAEDLADGELERVSENPLVRSIFIRYEVGGRSLQDTRPPIASGLAVPIRAQGSTVGVLSVFSRSVGRRFTDSEQRALESIAARVAPFIEARLQAYVDELTSLNNFRFFEQTLLNEVAAAQRYDRRLGLLALDLDGFKAINDTPGLGHQAGDELLRAVARLARRRIRASDVACRKGGDEFVVILPESGLESAELLYQRLQREVVALRIEYAGRLVGATGVSGGVAELRREDDARSFFVRADEALVRAKTWGKGRVAWGEGDRPEPPPEADYRPAAGPASCAACAHFRPGKRGIGYCERWYALVEAAAACAAFEPRDS